MRGEGNGRADCSGMGVGGFRQDARAVVGAIGGAAGGWRVEGRGEWVGGVVGGGGGGRSVWGG